MLYRLLYIPSKFALWIYCRFLSINNRKVLSLQGPLLIAANHPNSFLDAIVLSSLFKQPIYSLARGDAFTNQFHGKLLRSMNMLPVYRITEGVENLENNYETFDACKEIFKKNGIVLIFSEGRCINVWRLRPLMKGTARLALSSWHDGIPLNILPLGINYQSFRSFGKNIHLNFGNIISEKNIPSNEGYGKTINEFNDKLRSELKSLVIEIVPAENEKVRAIFFIKQPVLKQALLFIPALAGYFLHAPLYIPIKILATKIDGDNDHFDSLVVGLLFILYPFYLLMIGLLVYWLTGGFWWMAVFILSVS